MESVPRHRPRVPRETRLLLTTALLAVMALWILARVRFPGPPGQASVVPAILTGLSASWGYDALAGQVGDVQARLTRSLMPLEIGSSVTTPRLALRMNGDFAVLLLKSTERVTTDGVDQVARDTGSGLAIVRLPEPSGSSLGPPRVWRPASGPQYLMVADSGPAGWSIRPTFVGDLVAADAPLWAAQVWTVPDGTPLTPGTLVFTTTAEFVGLVIEHRNGVAVLPAETVLSEADRLIADAGRIPGDLGIDVQPLTPALQRLSGATAGVAIAAVRPDGAAHNSLQPGDVIESIGARAITGVEQWQRVAAQLAADAPVRLAVRRQGTLHDVRLAPRRRAAPKDGVPRPTTSLGLAVRPAADGVEITAVSPASVAARSGLAVGDVITMLGSISRPTPAQVQRAGTALRSGDRILVGVRRDGRATLTVLEP
jgi:hypothetical protein